ncbi:MAG: hypothetical protein ACLVFF_03260 [Coprococcus comes]
MSEENFRIFEFVQEMNDQSIRLIPIIDAVSMLSRDMRFTRKVSKQLFLQREDGSDFVAVARRYPFSGYAESEARKWFGDKYRF